MEIKTTDYDNFKCSVVAKDTPVVSVIITADLHASNSPQNTLVGELLTDLLLAGAGKYSRDDFLQAVAALGSSINVSFSQGRLTISLKSLAENLSKTLKLLEVAITNPTFSTSEYKRATKTVKNSLELYKEEARTLAEDALKRSFYGETDRHYRYEPVDLIKALNKIKLTDIKSLHKSFLTTFWFVSIGGNKKSVKTTLSLFKRLKKKPVVPKTNMAIAVLAEKSKKSKVLVELVSSKQNVEFSIGGHLPFVLGDKDFMAFTFGLTVLGKWGGFAGRLMSTVREKEGLTYTIYARTEGVSKTETGYWRILTFFAPKDAVTGVKSTLREIKKIYQEGITEEEWGRFKEILKTGEALSYDSLAGTVSLVHSALVSGIDYEEYKKYQKMLYEVSREDINKTLKQYLLPENVVISAAGPIDKKLEKELKMVIK
ncbi:MAG: pitrilysin family protein [Candidatus Paceibacterota bacterium]